MYRIEYLFKDGASCIDEVETLTEVADTLDIANFDSKHDGLIITVRNEGQPIWRYQIEVVTRIDEIVHIRRKRVEVKQ